MKDSKYYKKMILKKKANKDRSWLSKLLISIIIVLSCLIVTNFSNDLSNKFKKNFLEKNISFSYIKKIYNKYIGGLEDNDTLVANVINDNDYEVVDGSYKFSISKDEGIEVMKPGIIVYNSLKDDLGNTIIVQGNDGIDIWYSNVSSNEYSLYDYVSSGDILGNSDSDYYLITIVKDGEKLKYEEYFK